MYQHFFNFNAEPFRLSPDHAFAFAHKGYIKAQAYMVYAFQRAEGFVMITGRPGTGKTTLIGALWDQLAGEDVITAHLVCTQLKADDLLKMVAYEFGISPAFVEKADLLQRLTHQLKSWHLDGCRALLIVDEAQDLSPSAMEELRLLTNIQVDSKPLLQIFLLGQPELRELILSPRMEQVHQRIIAASHLEPLELDETGAYIRHRLESVGWRGDPAISAAVYPLVHKFSEGIPRRINLIFSRLLLHCAVDQRHRICIAHFREVIAELQEENLAAGTAICEQDFDAARISEAHADRDWKRSAKTADGGVASAPATAVDKRTTAKAGARASQRAEPTIPQKKKADKSDKSRLTVVPENISESPSRRSDMRRSDHANGAAPPSAPSPQRVDHKSTTAMRWERKELIEADLQQRQENGDEISARQARARLKHSTEIAQTHSNRAGGIHLVEPNRRLVRRSEKKIWPAVVILIIVMSLSIFGVLGMLDMFAMSSPFGGITPSEF